MANPSDDTTTGGAATAAAPTPLDLAEARQRRYAESRRRWADAVGRPYVRQSDPRPPPGELDVVADDE